MAADPPRSLAGSRCDLKCVFLAARSGFPALLVWQWMSKADFGDQNTAAADSLRLWVVPGPARTGASAASRRLKPAAEQVAGSQSVATAANEDEMSLIRS